MNYFVCNAFFLIVVGTAFYVTFINNKFFNSEPDPAKLYGVALLHPHRVQLFIFMKFIFDDSPDSICLVLEGIVIQRLGVIDPILALFIDQTD